MRAKFRVSRIEPSVNQLTKEKISERLAFDAVYSNDPTSENKQWSMFTPYGHLEMQVDNPAAFDHFTVMQEVYVDITPVPKP